MYKRQLQYLFGRQIVLCLNRHFIFLQVYLFLVRNVISLQEILLCQDWDLKFLRFFIFGRSRGNVIVDQAGGLPRHTAGDFTASLLDDFFQIIAAGIMAVSYTHLDVYKRQE